MKAFTLARIWPFLPLVLGGMVLLLVAGGVYGWYRYDILSEEFASTKAALEANMAELESDLARAKDDNQNLSEALERERAKNSEFQNQINDIASSVGTLEKLSKTDAELLKKYSKVYFLNENYVPENLVSIDAEYLSYQDRPQEVRAEVLTYLEDMLDAAKRSGIILQVSSGYRSFETQAAIKDRHTVVFGSGANTFSADQGYSEHQLGTTVDLTTPGSPALTEAFENTDAYEWLQKNAWKYGFTLSYPRGNAYYIFEPWHWRFVGVDLARFLRNENKHFYDLEQRTIDPYLLTIFD